MSQVVELPNHSYQHIINTAWVPTRLCKLQKKDELDSQPQVIKITSCLRMVGGSLRILRLLPPLKTGRHDIVEMLLKRALSTTNQSFISQQSVLLVEEIGENTDLSPVTAKLSPNVVSNILRYESDSNFQLQWWQTSIAQVLVNVTTIRSRPQRPLC